MERELSRAKRRVVILGSTGSIGAQTLDVIRALPEEFEVLALAAGSNERLLRSQIEEFRPRHYCLRGGATGDFDTGCTYAQLAELATLDEADLVVLAMSGDAALRPALDALRRGKTVALANKELVVMAGEHLLRARDEGGGEILPVDSEPSAIWQCIRGEAQPARRLIITASGGAFRDRSFDALRSVSPEEALEHPTWRMGQKVTIDSATLMNKALEVIEARWLFGVPYDRIEVVVHRQSIIHSMVEFQDGSVKAQMGPPDMRFPIQCALMYPDRVENPSLPRFDPVGTGRLTFEELDTGQYPCFDLALRTARRGGTWPAALVGADEAAVGLFLEGKINFTDISSVVEAALSRHRPTSNPTIDDIITASAEAFEEAWSVADPQPAAWSARGAMRLDTA